jgi:uncharacterized protein (UPF0332 family)
MYGVKELRFDLRASEPFGKARRSLRGAQLLQADGLPGFAASRAYYAMFYVAEALLLNLALSFSSHKAVIAAFGKHLAKTGEVPVEFHRYLVDAQEDRTTGDYGLLPDVTVEEAAVHITRAHALLALAEAKLA